MKKFAFGFAAAVALGLVSLAAPASAAAPAKTGIEATVTDVSAQRMVRKVIRRGPNCTVKKVVRRGPMGRRIVSTTRVCR